MEIADLSEQLELITQTTDEHKIAAALRSSLGTEKFFRFWEPILGAPRSGRIFSAVPHPKGKPVSFESDPESVARQLMILIPDARFDGNGTSRDDRKGWEVFKLSIGGRPAAMAWAIWTSE